MAAYRVIKEIGEDILNNPLTAKELISEINSLIPNGYDIPIKFIQGNLNEDNYAEYSIEFDDAIIAVLVNKKGQAVSVHLFAK